VNIHEATQEYERWLARETQVVATALRDKHARMRDDLYAFLRGTFYRWAQLCPAYVPEARRAPRVLADARRSRSGRRRKRWHARTWVSIRSMQYRRSREGTRAAIV
jgi:hypothetical protein